MTALAFAFDPALEPQDVAPPRPQLRLIQGGGSGTLGPIDTPVAASVEVYRRRRFLAFAATAILIVGLAWAAGVSVLSFGEPSTDPITTAAPAVHVVMPGDSYGAIASEFGLANPAEAAIQLRAANGGGELVVGQRVVIDLAALAAAG